jgi:V-type H+-transporting ATPase subunit G
LQVLGSKGDAEARITDHTRIKIEEINRNVGASREQAIQRLMTVICDVKPELHQNLKL